MVADGVLDFAPALVGSAYEAMSIWVQVIGGSWFGESYQPYATNEAAYPGSQAAADNARTVDFILNDSNPSPAYTYVRDFYQDQLDWEAPYDGTLSNAVFYVPYNERINPVTLTIYKNQVATTMKVVVGRLETGAVKGTGTVSFVTGDVIVGKVTSAIQDTDDPEYVGESTHITSFTMTLTVTGAVMVPYRTTAHSTNFVYEEDTSFGYGGVDDWPVAEPTGSNAASARFGIRFDPQESEAMSLANSTTVGADNALYGAKPIVCIEDGTFSGRATSTANGWSESESRRVMQMKVRAPGTFSDVRFYGYITVRPQSWYVAQSYTTGLVDGRFEVGGTASLTRTITFEESGTLSFAGTLAVTDGQLLNFAAKCQDADGTVEAGITLYHFRSEFESDDDWFDIHAHGYDTRGMTYAQYTSRALTITATDMYFAVWGGTNQSHKASSFHTGTTYRTWHEQTIAEGMEFKRLRCQVGVLSGGTVRVGLMADGVKLTQYVDITTTGWAEDAVRTDQVNVDGIGGTANICYYVEKLTGTPVIRFDSFEITAKVIDQTGATVCDQDCPEGLTLQTMQERTLRMLGEDPDNPVYWTAAEIGRHINDAYRIANRETKCIQYVEGIVLTSGDDEATLSDQVGQVLRATFDDRTLTNVTKWEQDRNLADWENDSGYVDRYITTLHDSRVISTYKAWDGTQYNSYGPFDSDGAHTYTVWEDANYAIGDRVTYEGSDGITRAYYAYDTIVAGDAAFYEPEVGSDWTDVWKPIPMMVWAIMNPPELTECDEPLLPPWTHIALCFAAAARALRKYGEQRNDQLADVYEAMAADFAKALKSHVGNRTPERLEGMGRATGGGIRKPKPWDTEIVG